jgi:hypothetical protein
MIKKLEDKKKQSADAALCPWNFPLGSIASRAAARAMLEHRKRSKNGIRMVIKLIGHPKDQPLPENTRNEGEDWYSETVYERCGGT